MPKKLQKAIEIKLEKLQELLDSITEAQIIDPQDSETWDPDTLYNLIQNLKETLQLLQDQKLNRRNEFGESIVFLEPGLCSLLDTWEIAREEEEND